MILLKFKEDQDFWEFLQSNYQVVKNIQNWNIYRRASLEPTIKYDKNKNMKNIFVSYSRFDAGDFVGHLVIHLSNFGYDIFTDVSLIRGGDNWSKTIEENISNCDMFVVIVTPRSLKSSEVEKEVLLARRKK